MQITALKLSGLLLFEPVIYRDQRGEFVETWQHQRYRQAGITATFVQDNRSVSKRNVIRGFHYQITHPFGQLISVTEGSILDVLVDLRPNSATFKQWVTLPLSAERPQQVYMPPGFAHGFCSLAEHSVVNYKCTGYYMPEDEGGFHWQSLPITWPCQQAIVSAKDQARPYLADLTPEHYPQVTEQVPL